MVSLKEKDREEIIGHIVQRKYLTLLDRLGTVPPALLFFGKDSIGKKKVATWWVKRRFCETGEACGNCKQCILFTSGNHPDVFILDKQDKEILVSDIKMLQQFVMKKPYYGRNKCILIDNVENMNQVAANAFLKILEEPPTDTFFILISSNFHKLLPTIRSRCMLLKFNPLNSKELSGFVSEDEMIYEGTFSPLIPLSKEKLKKLFTEFISSKNKKTLILKHRDHVKLDYKIFAVWLHDILVCLLNKNNMGYNIISRSKWRDLDLWIRVAEFFFEQAEFLDVINLGIVEAKIAAGIRMLKDE